MKITVYCGSVEAAPQQCSSSQCLHCDSLPGLDNGVVLPPACQPEVCMAYRLMTNRKLSVSELKGLVSNTSEELICIDKAYEVSCRSDVRSWSFLF
ncbi:hypothetical protein J6590_057757 [Homalodisca vitripennis]|nr:hypothetical protein J6590_057757 [Homalodisca vitripennis]